MITKICMLYWRNYVKSRCAIACCALKNLLSIYFSITRNILAFFQVFSLFTSPFKGNNQNFGVNLTKACRPVEGSVTYKSPCWLARPFIRLLVRHTLLFSHCWAL